MFQPIAHTLESVLLRGQGIQKRAMQGMLLVLFLIFVLGLQTLLFTQTKLTSQMQDLQNSVVVMFHWEQEPDADQFANWQGQINQMQSVAFSRWQPKTDAKGASNRGLLVRFKDTASISKNWLADVDTGTVRTDVLTPSSYIKKMNTNYELFYSGILAVLVLFCVAMFLVMLAQIQARLLLDMPHIAMLHGLGAQDGFIIKQVTWQQLNEIFPVMVIGTIFSAAVMYVLTNNIAWAPVVLCMVSVLLVLAGIVCVLTNRMLKAFP